MEEALEGVGEPREIRAVNPRSMDDHETMMRSIESLALPDQSFEILPVVSDDGAPLSLSEFEDFSIRRPEEFVVDDDSDHIMPSLAEPISDLAADRLIEK